MLLLRLTEGRTLDRGNPNPGNLGSDFGRFGLTLWPDIIALDITNVAQQSDLDQLLNWRNAIAHQSFDAARLGARREIRLADVRRWRRTCNSLARAMDRVVRSALTPLVGFSPW